MAQLGSGKNVTLSDGSSLNVAGEGTVGRLGYDPDRWNKQGVCTEECAVVPELAYNLVSVSRVAEAGKTVHFCNSMTEFRNEKGEVIALGARQGSLNYLKFSR